MFRPPWALKARLVARGGLLPPWYRPLSYALGQCDIWEVLGKTVARKVTFGPLPVYFWSGAWSLGAEPAATWVESMDDGSYIFTALELLEQMR